MDRSRSTRHLFGGLALAIGFVLGAIAVAFVIAPNDKADEPPRKIASDIEGTVLFIADAFRGDLVGMKVGGVEVTPYINRLAREGTWFENAYSSGNYSTTGVASIVSGEPPQVHGVIWCARVVPEMDTLAGILRSAGFNTVGIVNNTWLQSDNGPDEAGFSRGFDEYTFFDTKHTVLYGMRAGEMPLSQGRGEVDAVLRDHLLGALDGAEGSAPPIRSPFYAQMHSMTTHWPYPPEEPNEFTGRFLSLLLSKRISAEEAWKIYWKLIADMKYNRKMDCPGAKDISNISDAETTIIKAMYLEAAATLDNNVKLLLEDLKRRSTGKIRFIFTADHGESMGGEEGEFEHGKRLGESATRVPLIFWGEGFESRRVTARVPNYCIAHTLLDVLGIDSPENTMGYSLLDVHEKNMPIYACMDDAATYISQEGHRVERLRGGSAYVYYDLNGDKVKPTDGFSEADKEALKKKLETFERTAAGISKLRGIEWVYSKDEWALRLAGLSDEEIEKITGGKRAPEDELKKQLEVMKSLGYMN